MKVNKCSCTHTPKVLYEIKQILTEFIKKFINVDRNKSMLFMVSREVIHINNYDLSVNGLYTL